MRLNAAVRSFRAQELTDSDDFLEIAVVGESRTGEQDADKLGDEGSCFDGSSRSIAIATTLSRRALAMWTKIPRNGFSEDELRLLMTTIVLRVFQDVRVAPSRSWARRSGQSPDLPTLKKMRLNSLLLFPAVNGVSARDQYSTSHSRNFVG